MRPSTLGFWASLPLTVSAKVGGRRHDAVGHDLRVPAGHANRAGEAGGRVEPQVAGRRDRPAVGRRAAQPIDADRIAVGDEDAGDSGEPETRLVVTELAIRQPDRPLRLGLGDRPAQLKRERERACHPAAGKRQSVVGEPGVEPAVDPQIERALARERRRSGHAKGIGAARIGRGVDRGPPSGEPARSRHVERRQGVAARLRQGDLPEPDAPVAGRIARRSADRRLAVGGSRTRRGPAKRDRAPRAAAQSRLRGGQAWTRRGRRATGGRNRRAGRGSAMSSPSPP